MGLQFLDANNNPTTLPEWADDLIKIGIKSWHSRETGSQIVIGLSLPTIDYASSLVAFGAVKEAIKSDISTGDKSGLSFEALCGMLGASVEFKHIVKGRRGPKIVSCKGILDSVDEYMGRQRLEVRFRVTKSMIETKAFHAEDVGDISLIAEHITDAELTGGGTILGRANSRLFVSGLLNSKELNQLYSVSRTGILLVENKRRFSEEILACSFASGNEKGCLGEIVRPDCIYQYEHSAKASFFSSASKITLQNIATQPIIAILGGSRAVIRNLKHSKAQCTIALLDRNESNCSEAEEMLNNQFKSRVGDFEIDGVSANNHLTRMIAFKY